MCDDWYRSPSDGACFGVLDPSRLRPSTYRPALKAGTSKPKRGKAHWATGAGSVCGIKGKTTLLFEDVTCLKCIRGLKNPF